MRFKNHKINRWNNFIGAVVILPALCCFSCNDEPIAPLPETGRVIFNFHHLYKGETLEFDTQKYSNTAGNQLLFSEIQYFISDMTLHYNDGSVYLIDAWKDIHYIDSDLPTTQSWIVFDSIPAGNCDSVSFTFGINEGKNQSFLFGNPPESFMFWPDVLGGGYHYLKLNGKWLAADQQMKPFNFHLGIGQQYDSEGNITGFIQNYFRVIPDGPSFEIIRNDTLSVAIEMNVESWFDTPNLFDFNSWGGDIMQNQAAMQAGCENGRDVFTLVAGR